VDAENPVRGSRVGERAVAEILELNQRRNTQRPTVEPVADAGSRAAQTGLAKPNGGRSSPFRSVRGAALRRCNEVVAGEGEEESSGDVVRVLIADDHRLLLEALQAALAPVADIEVVAVTPEAGGCWGWWPSSGRIWCCSTT
jgi:hypothetical protein